MFSLPNVSSAREKNLSQKSCPKCFSEVHRELSRCGNCGHSPWLWRTSVRLLLLIMVLIVPFYLLGNAITTHEVAYHTPTVAPSPDPQPDPVPNKDYGVRTQRPTTSC